jgi:hypothetical protein
LQIGVYTYPKGAVYDSATLLIIQNLLWQAKQQYKNHTTGLKDFVLYKANNHCLLGYEAMLSAYIYQYFGAACCPHLQGSQIRMGLL